MKFEDIQIGDVLLVSSKRHPIDVLLVSSKRHRNWYWLNLVINIKTDCITCLVLDSDLKGGVNFVYTWNIDVFNNYNIRKVTV